MEENEVAKSEEKGLPSDNSNELYNLIQSIQSKLNNENPGNSTYNEIDDKTINNTEKNVANESNKKSSNNQDSNSQFNFSNIGSLLQNFDIGTIMNVLNGSKSQNNTQNNTESSGFNIGDIDESTIFRIQKIISSIGKKDPKKDLLLSLKPFLRKSRQDKIGEYVTMLTVANALGIFNRKGSDENV